MLFVGSVQCSGGLIIFVPIFYFKLSGIANNILFTLLLYLFTHTSFRCLEKFGLWHLNITSVCRLTTHWYSGHLLLWKVSLFSWNWDSKLIQHIICLFLSKYFCFHDDCFSDVYYFPSFPIGRTGCGSGREFQNISSSIPICSSEASFW